MQAAFLARFLPLEQPLGVARQFENLHTLIHVGLLGGLVALDFPQAAVLFLASPVRHSLEEGSFDQPIELVDIHCINAIQQPLELDLVAPDRLLVLAAFVDVARMQHIAHPFQELDVELQPPAPS